MFLLYHFSSKPQTKMKILIVISTPIHEYRLLYRSLVLYIYVTCIVNLFIFKFIKYVYLWLNSHIFILVFFLDYQELNCMNALSEDFGHLFDDKVYSDVQVKCGDKIWNAHKNILSVRSKTLGDIVQSITKEGQSSFIEIKNLETKIVEAFLKYLYTGKLAKMATEDIKKLYAAADKYAVSSLKVKCAALLIHDIKPETACEILALSNQFRDMDLKENVIDYIVEKKIPLDNDVWENFCKSFPVLATEVLNVFCKHQFSK